MSEEKLIETLDQRLNDKKEKIAANLLKVAVERVVKESKWFTSIGLALLGFFSALLIQLKLAEIQPLNLIAVVAILSLVISLGSGFWIKLCSMRDDIGDDLESIIEELLIPSIKDKLKDFNKSDVLGTSNQETKEKSDSDKILESVADSLPNRLIILQGISLFISIISVFIYLMNFLL